MSKIKQISELSGVSVPTVYKVFSNTYPTSAKAKEKVLQAAKELNYTPDKLKKNKKPDMSKAIIGIVVGSVLNSFFNSIISGINNEFERYNYHIIVLYCNGDPLKMHKNLELLQSISANAIIFEPMESYRLEIVEELRKNGTVMLQLFSQVYKNIDVLRFNDELGTYMAVNKLIEYGHRSIAMFYKKWDLCPEREPGYIRAFEENGLTLDYDYICRMDFSGNIRNLIREKLIRLKPTAILSVNEMMSINVIQTLNEMKLKVPEDMSLIIYDDLPWVCAYDYTAISHPFDQISSMACEIVLNRLQNACMDNSTSTILEIDPIFISRGSTTIAGKQ